MVAEAPSQGFSPRQAASDGERLPQLLVQPGQPQAVGADAMLLAWPPLKAWSRAVAAAADGSNPQL